MEKVMGKWEMVAVVHGKYGDVGRSTIEMVEDSSGNNNLHSFKVYI